MWRLGLGEWVRDRESGWQKARLHFAFGVAAPGAWEVVVCSPPAPDWLTHLALYFISSLLGWWGGCSLWLHKASWNSSRKKGSKWGAGKQRFQGWRSVWLRVIILWTVSTTWSWRAMELGWFRCKTLLSLFSCCGILSPQLTCLSLIPSSVTRIVIVPSVQAFCEGLMRMHLNP